MRPAGGGRRSVNIAFAAIFLSLSAASSAKSLYVIKDLNAGGPVRAYAIVPAPQYLGHQGESAQTGYGAVGIAMHEPSKTLFVTIEGTGSLCMLDAATLRVLGYVATPGAANLAGIAVDGKAQRVYAVDRNSDKLFSYDWDPETRVLTPHAAVSLPGVSRAMGIALDEAKGRLYVADAQTATVRYFSTADWSLAGSFTLRLGQRPMGIALDAPNGIIYTGNAAVATGSPALLSRYDLNTGVETAVNLRALTADSSDCVVGIAVDPDTGLVYVTTGNQVWGGSSRLMVFSPGLSRLLTGPALGHPTGICIPVSDISYGGNRCPIAAAGPPQIVEQSSLAGASVALDGSDSSDPDGDPLTYTWTWPGGSASGPRPVVSLPHGLTAITLAVNDGEADSEPDTTTVTVQDTTAPVLVAPADITAEQTSAAGTTVPIGDALAADVCDVAPVVTDDAPEAFPLGVTLVTWTAVDQAGNVAKATQKVTIVDTTPPEITSVWAAPSILWPPDKRMVSVQVGAVVEDICDAAPSCRIVAVASSDAVSGPGAGDLAPDWVVTGDLTVDLRAERLGAKMDRVYTITVRATDASGNSSSADLLVIVPHDQGSDGGKK